MGLSVAGGRGERVQRPKLRGGSDDIRRRWAVAGVGRETLTAARIRDGFDEESGGEEDESTWISPRDQRRPCLQGNRDALRLLLDQSDLRA